MFQVIVTGKIEHVQRTPETKQDGAVMVFRLRETFYNKEKSTRVWRVSIPPYLEKTAEALLKEGYSVGVVSSKFVLQDDFSASPPVPVMWLEAEKLFYL